MVETLDLLIDRDQAFSDIQICREAYLEVQHCLLGHALAPNPNVATDTGVNSAHNVPSIRATPALRRTRTKPLTDLQHIKFVLSHPQALGQCGKFVATYLPDAERYEVSSTSEAARLVREDRTGTKVAISSSLAAELNGLDILARSIQDVEENTTRFLVIHRGSVPSEDRQSHLRKALVTFGIDHSKHGALASALLIFKNHDLNLTSIYPRPSQIRPWHYQFLVEFEGTHHLEPIESVKQVLSDLSDVTEGSKWLGSWPNQFSQR